MYNNIIFYNYWQNGDLFESREFVKKIMKLIPAKEYFYAHRQNKRTFDDIDGLQYLKLSDSAENLNKDYFIIDNDLYINTWIGKKGLKYGCSVESIFKLYSDLFTMLKLGKFPGKPLDYLPSIDYSKFQLEGVDDFLKNHREEKILVCNGNVQSGQMSNFDFSPIVLTLSSKYPDRSFILTKKTTITRDNIFFTDDITKTSDGFDINEISYLSTDCNILVGRYSGPHTCSQVKENWLDKNKRLVTFTHRVEGHSFIYGDYPEIKMKRFWTNSPSSAVRVISDAIERR